MRTILLAVVLTIIAISTAGAQVTSTYTSTDSKKCRTIRATASGAGSYVGECAGVGGFKARVIEGDLRQTIDIVTPAGKRFELNFWSFYPGFSAVGEKIEWRSKGGVPFAIIVRYNVADPEDSQKNTSYLMVAKIGKAGACVTDVVEPSTGQNARARELADTAGSRGCKAVNE